MNIQIWADKKERLSDGPWQDEPDWMQSEINGFLLIIARPSGGCLCGYIEVPQGHPWHGKNHKDPIFDDIQVHGGLSHSEPSCNQGKWILGFDCGHSGDIVPLPKSIQEEIDDLKKKWGVAIRGTYKTVDFVKAELLKLAEWAKKAQTPIK